MDKQFSSCPEQSVPAAPTQIASYSGLSVEIVCRMEHCSLVRYRDRELVVNTEDLRFSRSMRCAAR
jgi:hypothetical protein